MDLWVLYDYSDSTEGQVASRVREWKGILQSAKPTADSNLREVEYATDVFVKENQVETYSGAKNLSRTRLAIEHVAALADSERNSRILVFSDGYSTEPLDNLGGKLNSLGVPVDYRLVSEEVEGDYRVSHIELPSRVQVREPFVLGVTVKGSDDGEVPLRVYKNGIQISGQDTVIRVVNGVGKSEFSTRITDSGAYEFSVKILPESDTHLGNNTAEKWVEVVGGPRVILVSKYQNDPMAEALRAQGINVQLVDDPLSLKVGMLTGSQAVVINNVPAYEIPSDFLLGLDFYVRDQGGGLMMVGGKHSFGSGGYFKSPIDELLPISMELKEDHRKLSVAMAIVLDRSGSMAAVAGVAGMGTKMDLANSGTEDAIKLLGDLDSVAVYAVDSKSHEIVRQQQIAGHKEQMIRRVRRIQSMGGGIYVYTGMKDAWDALKKSPIATKHMILFADAADAEEPGDYKDLIAEMNTQNATISVIGLGTRRDVDAAFLSDIAKRGKGRAFFTQKAAEIPKLFAQETVTLARSAFVTDVTGSKATGFWADISPKPFQWLKQVDAYNLSYARNDATVSLVTEDEYLAPLVAHSRRGIGRTMAVSFPLGGMHSNRIRDWDGYGDFIQTVTRWLMGVDLPPGIGLRHKVVGTELSLDLLYDTEEWDFSQDIPLIKLIEEDPQSGEQEVLELDWRRIAPGHYSLSHNLAEGNVVRGVVQVKNHAIPFGPLAIGTSAEWAFDEERLRELRGLSESSGGRELVDLTNAWLQPNSEVRSDVRVPLLVALLLAMLLEALVTRTGWQFPEFKKIRRERRNLKGTNMKSEKPSEPESHTPVRKSAVNNSESGGAEARRKRYSRAKR
ncbi:VWA domain-containing protein [Rubritalea sp.]|uniref:VWA domain-containing protein n=1 Tax=Rubritalea sp. TaxID=2109375 RepID=UPI003EF5053D